MRDPKRINQILAALRGYWHANPDLRLGQIVGNCTPPGKDPYYLEDHDFIVALDEAMKTGAQFVEPRVKRDPKPWIAFDKDG
jgi:hypothetical protein